LTAVVEFDVAVDVEPIVDLDVGGPPCPISGRDPCGQGARSTMGSKSTSPSNVKVGVEIAVDVKVGVEVAVDVKVGVNVVVEDNVKPRLLDPLQPLRP
jgi:hypothetical protein